MEESDPGKSGIQELVAGLAAGQGMDPKLILFKWDRKSLVLPEHGLVLKQQVLNLRIYLGRKSEVLSFAESTVRSSIENAEAFVSAYTDCVIAALRRLKRPERGAARK